MQLSFLLSKSDVTSFIINGPAFWPKSVLGFCKRKCKPTNSWNSKKSFILIKMETFRYFGATRCHYFSESLESGCWKKQYFGGQRQLISCHSPLGQYQPSAIQGLLSNWQHQFDNKKLNWTFKYFDFFHNSIFLITLLIILLSISIQIDVCRSKTE